MMTFEEAVKYATGMSASEVKNMSISDHRLMMEKKFEKPTSFCDYYSLIGRGSVLHDCVRDHDSIEKEFLAAIGK